MGAAPAQPKGPLGYGIMEMLDGLLTPQLRDRVLDLASEINSGRGIPEEAELTRDFVEGPLRLAVQRLVGDEAADFVLRRLDPLLVMAGSGVRARSENEPIDEDAIPTPVPPVDAELLVASHAQDVLQALGSSLQGRARTHRVTDVLELITRVEARVHRRTVIVVDCREAAFDRTMWIALARSASPRCTLVFWGADELLRARLCTGRVEANDWIFTAPDATISTLLGHLGTLF